MPNLIQLSFSHGIAGGRAIIVVDPPNDVGPPLPGKDFYVSYISIFCHITAGSFVHCSMDLGEGSPWFVMTPQGKFNSFDVFVCSQQVGFVIRARNRAKLTAVSSGSGTVNLFLAGNFL